MVMKKDDNIVGNKNNDSSKSIELVHSGEDYFFRLQRIISSAKSEIHLQTYIFDNDSTGIKIANALKEAASRNVKVYVLLDSYGSSSLSSKFIKDLILCGINIRFFSPFFSSNNLYLGRRLHHKIVVVDGHIILIGGINISDKYHGTPSKEAWLDYAVQVENKPIAESVEQLCKNIYLKKKRTQRKNINFHFHSVEDGSVRIIQNDWLKRKNEIESSYIRSIREAKKEVIIVGSYFLPGRRLTNALKDTSRKGVKIKLILAGISDVPIIRRATCYLYSSLLKVNIELYEWNRSVLHGKAALIDNSWVTIGSFNLNHLSSYGSIEMNVVINSEKFADHFKLNLENIIHESENMTVEQLKIQSRFFTKIINWLSFQIVRLGLVIVTYIPYKRLAKQFGNNV